MSLLGLDVGTTGAKAVAFNLQGQAIASAYREYPLHSPRPGWQELDPNQVWQCLTEVLGEVALKTAADPIQTLAISSQGEAVHAVDGSGACITNSVVTFDARTSEIPQWWLERMSRMEIAQISGMPLHGMYTLNKILWFKQNCPEIYKKASKWLCYEDFVHYRLGLEPVISHSLAARTMALDVQAGQWSDTLLRIADIDMGLLARTAPSGEVVGTIPNRVADAIGLPHGIVVVTGGHDQPAGALGAGILKSGEALYATGTVECICPIFHQYAVTEKTVDSNLCCYPSCVQGLYASIAFNFTGGSLLRWYRDTLGKAELAESLSTGQDVYDILCGEVSLEPENLLVLPHFTVTGTPHFDTQSRGAIVGLTLGTSRQELVGALLSGVTYEMKLNLEMLQGAGVQISQLRAAGGGAKSAVWVQRKADILGVPVAVLNTSEAASLGVAMLGGAATGLVSNIRDVIDNVVTILRIHEPDVHRVERFNEMFEMYKRLYPALKDLNHLLASRSGQGN
ncbi:MAG: carbohydrate kinase [Candidatus Hydrogenedentota bacterium]